MMSRCLSHNTCSYDALKKYVYQFEKQQVGLRESYHDLEANESTSLMGEADAGSTDIQFIPLLDRELRKICLFYHTQEKELLEDVAELQRLVDKQEESGPDGDHHFIDEDEDEDDEDEDDDFDLQSPSISAQGTTRSYQSPHNRRHRSRSESAGAFPGLFRGLSFSYYSDSSPNR